MGRSTGIRWASGANSSSECVVRILLLAKLIYEGRLRESEKTTSEKRESGDGERGAGGGEEAAYQPAQKVESDYPVFRLSEVKPYQGKSKSGNCQN